MKYKADPRITGLVNKQVPFKYHGEQLKFDLSMGLFSSFDIDAGSRLLLKTLAKHGDMERFEKAEAPFNAIDTGCGTGVLGICLKKKYPALNMRFQDRDELAVAFTRHNAALNGISPSECEASVGLLLDDVEPDSQDLVICNIPAKAGDHVIKDFIRKASSSVSSGGLIAVVIVDSLKELVHKVIRDNDIPLLYSESTKMHSVFHLAKGKEAYDIPFDRYIRHKGPFKMADDPAYALSTVYNLPDFDQLSFWLHVSGELLRHNAFTGDALYWNPGQGHVPVWLNSRKSNKIKNITLASRDVLQNRICKYNLEQTGFEGGIVTDTLPDESFLLEKYGEESFDGLFINLNPIPRVKWHKNLADTALGLVRKGRTCFIMARSSDMSQLEKHLSGFHVLQDDRFKGNRGILLKKN